MVVAKIIMDSYKIWLKTPAKNGSAHNETTIGVSI